MDKAKAEAFIKDLTRLMFEHNILSSREVRDTMIIEDYHKMKKEGIKGREARQTVAIKYCTSEKNIQNILYGRRIPGIINGSNSKIKKRMNDGKEDQL